MLPSQHKMLQSQHNLYYWRSLEQTCLISRTDIRTYLYYGDIALSQQEQPFNGLEAEFWDQAPPSAGTTPPSLASRRLRQVGETTKALIDEPHVHQPYVLP